MVFGFVLYVFKGFMDFRVLGFGNLGLRGFCVHGFRVSCCAALGTTGI